MHKTQIEIRGVFWAVALVFSVFLVLPMALLLGKAWGITRPCWPARHSWNPSGTVF